MKLSGRALLAVALAMGVGVSLACGASAAPQSGDSIPHAHEEITLKGGRMMIYDQNVAVTLRDGHVVYANVFRPKAARPLPGRHSAGAIWQRRDLSGGLCIRLGAIAESQPGYLRAVVLPLPALGTHRSRALGWRWLCGHCRSMCAAPVTRPGYLDLVSAREARDFYDAIEWAGGQLWSNGKVGLLGISYMAINQWQVAALQPPHLAAIDSLGRRIGSVPRGAVSRRHREQCLSSALVQEPDPSQSERQRPSPPTRIPEPDWPRPALHSATIC